VTPYLGELAPLLLALGLEGIELAPHLTDPARLRYRPADFPPPTCRHGYACTGRRCWGCRWTGTPLSATLRRGTPQHRFRIFRPVTDREYLLAGLEPSPRPLAFGGRGPRAIRSSKLIEPGLDATGSERDDTDEQHEDGEQSDFTHQQKGEQWVHAAQYAPETCYAEGSAFGDYAGLQIPGGYAHAPRVGGLAGGGCGVVGGRCTCGRTAGRTHRSTAALFD
jgi:hypothetical protein